MNYCQNYNVFRDLIKDIKIAMLSTQDHLGCIRSIPMMTMKTECEGVVWFFTNFNTEKVSEIRENRCVNLAYTDVERGIYVSVSGKAEIVNNRSKMQEMWKPWLNEWISAGLEDESLALLKIHMEKIEYWNEEEGKMVQIWDQSQAVYS
ncbi:pyridoxamine 5'-phosphate oxidase family protein [Cytophagaceae bacterium ABcell3]|nr:pyridoxamine 5'-phosphate oxidase family protein [Cytophagaceae bacterium ABcell3]